MEQSTLSVKRSGEMKDSLRRFSFLLKGVFESEIFQPSTIYTLNSRLKGLKETAEWHVLLIMNSVTGRNLYLLLQPALFG